MYKVDDVEGLAAAVTKLLKLKKDEAEISFIIEQIVWKLLRMQKTRPFPPPARFQWIRVLLTLSSRGN